MSGALVDTEVLRAEIQDKYRDVAVDPQGEFHFHTGRFAANRAGYSDEILALVPEASLESFAGVADPFSWGLPKPGEQVVDVGSGAGMDSLIAAAAMQGSGRVIGVDMTQEMLDRAGSAAADAGLSNVEFRKGFAEQLPVEDGWADLVISNGVINLVPDKQAVYAEVARVLRPGGWLQIADISVEKEVPESARCDIDSWTACIAGALLGHEWEQVIKDSGFVDLEFGERVDTFGGSSGEPNARSFVTYGYAIRATKPAE